MDIGTPLGSDRRKIKSITGMVGQTIGVMGRAALDQSRESADLLIQPDLEGYSNFDFKGLPKIIRLGYQAAELNADRLRPRSHPTPRRERADVHARYARPG